MKAVLCGALVAVLGSGCVTAREAIRQGQAYEACEAAASGGVFRFARPSHSQLVQAALEESDGRIRMRGVPAEEFEQRFGHRPTSHYGEHDLLVEVTLEGGRETQLYSAPVIDAPLGTWTADSYGPQHALRRVFDYEAKPEPHYVERPASGASVLLGLIGMATLVTPVLSAITGEDLVSPAFEGHRELVNPTEAQLKAWREQPGLIAAENLQRELSERSALRCESRGRGACTFLALLTQGLRLSPREKPSLLVFSVLHGFDAPRGGEPCTAYEYLTLRIAERGSLLRQLQATFPPQGLPLSQFRVTDDWSE